MNSLVVLFSVMVLASAKPSFPSVITYAAPAVALAPAAVSHQSRIDIKSTPAIVKTDVIAPAIAPAVVAAPIAYTAPIAVAPAAVATKSEFDIKASPAVISAIAAAPLAYSSPLTYGAPLAYGPHLAYGANIAYSTPFAAAYAPTIYTPAIAPAIAPALLKTAEKTEAEAPASPDAALPVAPTETPEVAAARAAHLEAKAFEESHQIQKRSVGIIATSPVVTHPVVTSYASSPIIYSSPFTRIAPVGLSSPYLTGAYGIHPY